MKGSILSGALAIVVCSSVLAALQPRGLLVAIYGDVTGLPYLAAARPKAIPIDNRVRSIESPDQSCGDPVPHEVRECDELEHQILASTVRLEWRVWSENGDGSRYTPGDALAGHATIKEGRYLVTHNHLGISPSDPKNGMLTTVSVYTANGKPVWLEAPLKLVSVASEDAETLVLDFGSYGSAGLFASFGLSSAEFRPWESLALQSGQEVAQINWDGTTADVDWVKVHSVITESGTPRLELGNFVRQGASGGGVFWNGYHIANTWTRQTVQNVQSGAILRRYSEAALNSSKVVAELP